jgi:hypothetical protein
MKELIYQASEKPTVINSRAIKIACLGLIFPEAMGPVLFNRVSAIKRVITQIINDINRTCHQTESNKAKYKLLVFIPFHQLASKENGNE